VIHNVSSEPSWIPTFANYELTSSILSKVARVAFTRTELGRIKQTDVNRVSGLIPYDGHATVLLAHEYAIEFGLIKCVDHFP
jgi:general transcription factor 3C protein 4